MSLSNDRVCWLGVLGWGGRSWLGRRRENRKTTDSFGLGQDLSEEVGAGGMARRQQDGMLMMSSQLLPVSEELSQPQGWA